jgi:tetratricopeptide (TPR) repeat protein
MAKRLTRKKLKQKDEFITTAEKLMNSATKHKSSFVIAGIVLLFTLIFASIGFYYYKDYSKRGSIAYFEDLHLYEVALNSHDKNDVTNALNAFESLKSNFKFLKISKLAMLYIGNCEYMLGNYDKAIETYKTFLSGWGDTNNYIASIAYNGEIQSYMGKNDYKSALVLINNVLKKKDDPFIQLTYIHAVDCYLELNESDKAIELLKIGIDNHSDNKELVTQLTNLIAYVKAKKQNHIVNFNTGNF